jgi:hypothetical protein
MGFFRNKKNKNETLEESNINQDIDNSVIDLNKDEVENTDNDSIISEDSTNAEKDNVAILEPPSAIFAPSSFVVGYYEGMTAKGLREYINGYVHKYFDAPNTTYYRMLKYDSGFIFEIHDGDYKLSYLKKIIDNFNNGENVVYVKLQHRVAKIQKNYNRIETYILPDVNPEDIESYILPDKIKMKPLISSGFGVVSLGIAIAFMGITSLFLSSLFKTILGKEETQELPSFNLDLLPSEYIEKLPKATKTSFVTKVWLENGKVWKKEERSIKTPEMIVIENNDRSINKITTYQNFTMKCFTKSGSFDQCNDDNIFFDKENFNDNMNVKNVTMKKGYIKVELNNNDFINYVPTVNNKMLNWKIECSKLNLASICQQPSTIIIENEIKENHVKDSKKDEPVKSEKENQIVPTIKETVHKDLVEKAVIQPIIKEKVEPAKEPETVIKEEPSKTKKPATLDTKKELKSLIPSNLDLDNLPDNVIVE